MADLIELARTSRSRCRECRNDIDEGELRFGSDREGFYGDGAEAYGWFHLKCASRRLPERLLAALKTTRKKDIDDYDALVAACSTNVKKSMSRYPYGERAPTGRAKCIRCNEAIAKDAFRVAVEREIVTGAFTRVGAAYLHPVCAVQEIGEAELGKMLIANSPMLSPADAKDLAAQCDAAALSQPPTKKPKVEPAPRADEGAELVVADALMDAGDVRGELIAIESQLAKMTPGDERFASAIARAEEIRPQAEAAWKKALGKGSFTLERGFPSIELQLGPKTKLPDHEWLMAVHATCDRVPFTARRGKSTAGETALAALIQTPSFTRVRHLKISRLPFSWDGLRGFCSCDEVKNLESLDIQLGMGPRALLMLLNSPRFERLTELAASTSFAIDPDVRGFESTSGLHALKRLRMKLGFAEGIAERFTRSPLAQRLELLGIRMQAIIDAPLPNLRTLIVEGYFTADMMKAFTRNKSLALEHIDFRETAFMQPDGLSLLASPRTLPSLRALSITSALDERVTSELRKRFGERLFVLQVEKPIAQTPVKPAAKRAAAKRSKKGRMR